MNLKNLMLSLTLITTIAACKNKINEEFRISGVIKNAPDQKVYLDQLYFSEQNPDVLDTGFIKSGKFSLKGKATEEGLFRIRFENNKSAFYFINDADEITFNADINDESLDGFSCNTRSNQILKNLLTQIKNREQLLNEKSRLIDSLQQNDIDSLVEIESKKLDLSKNDFSNYVSRFIDTCSSPVATMFSVGYTHNFDPPSFTKGINNLTKRFPEHKQIASVVDRYNNMIAEKNKPKNQTEQAIAAVGSIAPEITSNDTEGKPFALSQLRGKYVLVDFWASWCGPCRGENPYVVAAYQKYKNKNFTVLGVSLDEDKEEWLKAIKKDKLDWKHISDLKGWETEAVRLYGFDGIPYNVLIDPNGKILAKELREGDLDKFLSVTLK